MNGYGGDLWQFSPKSPDWTVGFRRKKASRTADLFLEPYRVETGRSFNLVVRYDDGTKVEIAFNGRKADPNLRMPSASLSARWIGQDRQDWVGTGPSVGPDGLQDARIHLSKISAKAVIKGLRIEGTRSSRWEFGLNPKLLSNAEFFRDPKDPSQGDVFFQPDRDLSAQHLKVTILYENERLDSATVVAGQVRSDAPHAAASVAQVCGSEDRRPVARSRRRNRRAAGRRACRLERPPNDTTDHRRRIERHGSGGLDLSRQRPRADPRRAGLRADGAEGPFQSHVRRPVLWPDSRCER